MKEFTKKLLSVPGIAALAVVIVTMLAMNPFARFSPSAAADTVRPAFRDQSLFFTGSTPADKAIWCGVQIGKGYTLHISGTADFVQGFPATPAAGTFIITFKDGDAMGFSVPAGFTLSTTHDLGGVPGVDDVVKITATGGVRSMMVTVHTDPGAVDPFLESLDGAPNVDNNFCTRANVDGATPGPTGGEAGHTSAALIIAL